VLDEPTVGLDPALRTELWDTFRGLAESGTTLIIFSRVMDQAARCDRLLMMREGRVIADTSSYDLLAHIGATDVEEANLRLVRRDAVRPGPRALPVQPGAVKCRRRTEERERRTTAASVNPSRRKAPLEYGGTPAGRDDGEGRRRAGA